MWEMLGLLWLFDVKWRCCIACWLSKAGVQRRGLETDICELSAYWYLLNYEMIQSRTACTLEFSFHIFSISFKVLLIGRLTVHMMVPQNDFSFFLFSDLCHWASGVVTIASIQGNMSFKTRYSQVPRPALQFVCSDLNDAFSPIFLIGTITRL